MIVDQPADQGRRRVSCPHVFHSPKANCLSASTADLSTGHTAKHDGKSIRQFMLVHLPFGGRRFRFSGQTRSWERERVTPTDALSDRLPDSAPPSPGGAFCRHLWIAPAIAVNAE